MKPGNDANDGRFEFKIDQDQLYAPRERMTAAELIDLAIEAKVLDPVEGGYTLEDEKKNMYAPDTVIDLDKVNVFFATENAPGPAS